MTAGIARSLAAARRPHHGPAVPHTRPADGPVGPSRFVRARRSARSAAWPRSPPPRCAGRGATGWARSPRAGCWCPSTGPSSRSSCAPGPPCSRRRRSYTSGWPPHVATTRRLPSVRGPTTTSMPLVSGKSVPSKRALSIVTAGRWAGNVRATSTTGAAIPSPRSVTVNTSSRADVSAEIEPVGGRLAAEVLLGGPQADPRLALRRDRREARRDRALALGAEGDHPVAAVRVLWRVELEGREGDRGRDARGVRRLRGGLGRRAGLGRVRGRRRSRTGSSMPTAIRTPGADGAVEGDGDAWAMAEGDGVADPPRPPTTSDVTITPSAQRHEEDDGGDQARGAGHRDHRSRGRSRHRRRARPTGRV